MRSIFAASSVVLAGSMSTDGGALARELVSLIVAKTLPTAVASFSSSPIPPMCMNITLGESKRKWLWSAVTSSPFRSAASKTAST